jgi:hypothetical protein
VESSEIVVWSLVTLVALVVWSLSCVMIMFWSEAKEVHIPC